MASPSQDAYRAFPGSASHRDAGFERATLTVDTGNATGALGLYERAGFAVRDTSVSWTKVPGAPYAAHR